MNDQRMLRSIKNKYTFFYKELILIFCFILVFVSTAYSPRIVSSELVKQIHDFFHNGVLHHSFFSLFEIIFLLILVLAKMKFNISFGNGSNIAKVLLTFAIICYIFRMINPNSNTINPILGMPLLSNINEYSFLFFIYITFFCNKLDLLFFIKILFKYVFIFSLIRGFIIFVMWLFFGSGFVRYSNVNITIWDGDTLFLFSFLQAISLCLYLINKKRIYLFSTILFLILVFFSQQRSTFYPGLIASFGGSLIYLKFKKKINKIIMLSIVLVPFIFLLSISLFQMNPNSKITLTFERYLTSIPGYKGSIKGTELSDSGHWEQSQLTTLSILAETPFWGIGYGNSEDEYLYGQSSNIHNAYAGMWYNQGIFTLFFYFYVIFIILSKLIYTIKHINKHNFNLFILKTFIIFFLIGYFFTAYFTSGGILADLRQQMLWFFLFVFAVRSDHKSYSLVFEQNNYNFTKDNNDLDKYEK